MNIVSETFRGFHLGGHFWRHVCIGLELITVEATVMRLQHPLLPRYQQHPYLRQLQMASPLSSEFD